MDQRAAIEARVLDAAESLYYERGVRAIGMDDIRAAAGVSLKRLYQLFPAKDALVRAYLERRDSRQRDRMAEFVDARGTPDDRLLGVFDYLAEWFADPGFHGCAFVNCHGELGSTSPDVVQAARAHKQAFHAYLADLVAAAAAPTWLADHLALIVEGAITTAAISGSAEPARHARAAAGILLAAARSGAPATDTV